MQDKTNTFASNQDTPLEAKKLEQATAISLFIPIYNAARIIRKSVRYSYEALSRLGGDFEIVVVDDSSTDALHKFVRILKRIDAGEGRQIRYISYDKGPSRRENLAKSFYTAEHEVVGFIDADLSCDVLYLNKAIELLKEASADIVIGSRYIKGAKVARRFMRRLFSFFYNATLRVVFNSKIKDHQCGLKVFRKSSALKIIDEMGYDDKYIRGWFWDAEFLIRAQKANLKIIEMPVTWHYADLSTFDIKRELRCLQAIFKLKKLLG